MIRYEGKIDKEISEKNGGRANTFLKRKKNPAEKNDKMTMEELVCCNWGGILL